ncbi:hypothetical protein [Streptomyces sp. NPDC005438]|uniref:hypothetical protein n=1 Tax=Streptomyces sp. NPDC005438 TaxID=3156880 RepID=UPI0033B4B51D
MKRITTTYPGQGSQVPGMEKDATQVRPGLSRSYYEAADDILGLPLSCICFEGDAEQLRDTAATQPAVFLTSPPLPPCRDLN